MKQAHRQRQPWRKRIRTRPGAARPTALTRCLLPGDIVLHREHGDFLGGLIAHFTVSPYSHAELHVGQGWCLSAEAAGVSYVAADRHGGAFIDICRVRALDDRQRAAVVAAARRTVAHRYEYSLLFGFPYVSRRAAFRRAANQAYICSEHVAWAFRQAGVALMPGRPTAVHAPADLAQSSLVSLVGSWHGPAAIEDAVLNHRHPRQGRRHRLAVALVNLLANPVSLRDDYYRALARVGRAAALYRRQPGARDNGIK